MRLGNIAWNDDFYPSRSERVRMAYLLALRLIWFANVNNLAH